MPKQQKNITLDDDTLAMLKELELETTLTASALVRQYIRDAFRDMRRRKATEADLLVVRPRT